MPWQLGQFTGVVFYMPAAALAQHRVLQSQQRELLRASLDS
jgi:hypothetical protein